MHNYCKILRNIVDTSAVQWSCPLTSFCRACSSFRYLHISPPGSGSCWRGISLLSVGNILPGGGGELGVCPDPPASYIPPCWCRCWYLPLESLSAKLRVEHRKLSPADSQPQPATRQQKSLKRRLPEITRSFTITIL